MAATDPERPNTAEDDGNADGTREVADPNTPTDHAAHVARLLAAGRSDASANEIQRLRSERQVLNKRKSDVTKQLKNETRKRARRLSRSSALTNDDLVEVLAIRHERAVAKAKAKAAAQERL